MPKFRVELLGNFHTFELYNARGAEIFDLLEAIECAEEQFGPEWACVYNGQQAMTRSAYYGDVTAKTF